MKLLTFGYTKESGDSSNRTLLVFSAPTDKYAGIDLSELDPEEAQAFVVKANTLRDKYLSDLNILQNSYDLKFRYRQFIPKGMSDITEI